MTKGSKKKNTKPSEMESKFQLLLTLIALLKKTRHKQKKSELEFLMVNQTFNLVPYRHCVYWDYKGGKVSINNMSGLVQIDSEGPYVQWLSDVIAYFAKAQQHKLQSDETEVKNSFCRLLTIKPEDCPKSEREEWKQWCPEYALLILLINDDNIILGGLWLDREHPFNKLDHAVLEDLADGYAGALQNFLTPKTRGNMGNAFSFFQTSGLGIKIFFMALIILFLIPVRTSATAPAEIVASNPDSINVPFDGVIDTLEVLPGQQVKKGDVLVRMDSTVLRNRVAMSSGNLEAAETALQKTQRESLADRKKLAEIALLQAQISQKSAEANFAKEMLEQAEIRADRDGIVIYSDPNALQGKPVQTGEQIMLLADPQDTELLIRMPVDSMIKIEEDVPARFFLNVMPLNYKKAHYTSIGYQATPDADRLMTYKIRGKFTDKNENMRIGWTGTGKVYGKWTILGFNILRRPLVAIRSKLGI